MLSVQVTDSIRTLSGDAIELLQSITDPFQDYQWHIAFEAYLCHDLGEARWLTLRKDDKAIALLPLLSRKEGNVKVLQSMAHFYSPRFSIITREPVSDELCSNFIGLAKSLFESHDIVRIFPLHDLSAKQLGTAIGKLNFDTFCYESTRNWQEQVTTDFLEYWQRRPSQLRTIVKRKSRKIEHLNHRYHFVGEDLDEKSLADFHAVYYRSWKRNEPYPAFIDAFAWNSARRGTLRLGMLYIEEQPAAAQFWLVEHGVASIFKLAYDPQYSDLSVGSLLSQKMFQRAFDVDKVKLIDYLTGDDEFKKDWMTQNLTLYALEGFNKTTLPGRLAHHKQNFSLLLRKFRSRIQSHTD